MVLEPWIKECGDTVVKDYIEDDQNSSLSDMPQVKHVIEHTIAEPKQPRHQYQLPPIQQAPQPVVVQPPAPPAIVSMQQPAQPTFVTGPAQQHIFAYPSQPMVHNMGTPQPDNRSMFNKSDMNEMFMMQNAQMHQMMMQKMMLGSLNDHSHHGHHDCHDCHTGCCTGHGYHGTTCIDCVPRVGQGSVHHHHYTTPPSQPAVHHYTTLPAMDMTLRGAPIRGELLGGYTYADPYAYSPVYDFYQ